MNVLALFTMLVEIVFILEVHSVSGVDVFFAFSFANFGTSGAHEGFPLLLTSRKGAIVLDGRGHTPTYMIGNGDARGFAH
jgi:hypothetical protein